jgi:GH24 family phage-related lysozyme (muramidase)
LYPNGSFHPVKRSHGADAKQFMDEIGDAIMAAWKAGYVRVINSGDSIYAHNEVMPPNERQKRALIDLAKETDSTDVKYDYGDDYKVLWSIHDVLETYHSELDDDQKYDLASDYFSIGQDENSDENYCWIWDGQFIRYKKGGTHGSNFSHAIADKSFKGWYDVDQNKISVVFPNRELTKLGNRRPTVDDIPQSVYSKLQSTFGKQKPTMVVFENGMREEFTANVQPSHVMSPDFIDFIKSVENPNKVGYKNGKWYPHKSPEGGLPTIGYGHKLTQSEVNTLSVGVDEKTVVGLLKRDLLRARDVVYKDHKEWVATTIKDLQKKFPNNAFYKNLKYTDPIFSISEDQLNMLTDFVYNLGSLKSFPNFKHAVFMKDWKTAKKEYKRSYVDSSGKRKELGRNSIFFDKFLANKQ